MFDREPGSHQVCPICYWEDNLVQLRFPNMPGAANVVSLVSGQRNFQSFGAADRRFVDKVREPMEWEQTESGWRALNQSRDNPEEPQRGVNYADSYPELDPTVLYYWRPTYWRRTVS